jgi:hypothetical protein
VAENRGTPNLRVQGGAGGGPTGSGYRQRWPMEGDCEENKGRGWGGSSDPVEVVAASETHSERPTVEAVPRRWGTAALPRAGGRGCHLRGPRGTW